MNKNIYLSVVVPSYNEMSNLKRGVLDEVYQYLSKQKYNWEVLLVDDGSTDETFNFLQKFAKKHKYFYPILEPHRGKAGTVIEGMLKAKGDLVLFTDTDQATPIDQIEKLTQMIDVGSDIAIGSRTGRKGAPLIRKIMAMGFVVLRTVILRMPYKDTQCGFKIFKKTASNKIFSKMKELHKMESIDGYTVTAGFDLEVLYLARKMGFRVSEVDVFWEEKGVKGRVNPIKDSWIGLRGLIQVRINAILGRYK